jgi:hypothetical protein
VVCVDCQDMAARVEVAMDEGVSRKEGLRACSSDLNRCTCRSRRRVGRCEFSRSVVIRHNLIDATGGLVKSQAAGCFLGRPGQGRREHDGAQAGLSDELQARVVIRPPPTRISHQFTG